MNYVSLNWVRAGGFAGIAFIAGTEPVMRLLHGHGWWVVLVAIIIGAPLALLAEKGVVPSTVAAEAQGLALAVIGPAIEYNSRFGVDSNVPYVLRILALFVLTAFFAWLGRRLYVFMAPGTVMEQAEP